MRERESMRMKNFIFKSSLDKDLLKIFNKLEIMQQQLRELRGDNTYLTLKTNQLVKGMAILVTQPEPDSEIEENGTTEDNTEGN